MTPAGHLLRFITLAGMIPAIMTSLIAPKNWIAEFVRCFGTCDPLKLLEPPLSVFGLDLMAYSAVAGLLLLIGLSLAMQFRTPRAVFALTPLLLFVLREPINQGADWAAVAVALIPPDAQLHFGEWLYNVSCSALFISLVIGRAHLFRTVPFAALLTILIFLIFYEPDFGMTELLFFTFSLIGARMVFLFLRENVDDFVRLGWQRTGLLFVQSFVLLVPIWLLIAGGFWLQSKAAGWVEDRAYDQRPLCTAQILREGAGGDADIAALTDRFIDAAGSICPASENEEDRAAIADQAANIPAFIASLSTDPDPCVPGGGPDPTQREIEADLCYFGELLHAGREAAIREALAAQYANTTQSAEDAESAVDNALRTAMPNVRIPHSYACKSFPWLPCEIGKTAKWAAEGAVNKAQDRVRGTISREAAEQISSVKDGTDNATDLASENAKAIADGIRRTTQSALSNSFDAMGVLDHAMFVLLCLMVLKAWLFVFARVAYSSIDRETAISLSAADEAIPEGKVINRGKRYNMPVGKFFYSKRGQMEGIAPKIAVPPPQAFACILGRLFGGAYFLSVADRTAEGAGPVVFKTGNIREFVEWELEAGEEVIFQFKNFIAMEDSIQLSTFVSFKLSNLLLGRLLFRRATGPGRLILRTTGPAETSAQTDSHLSKPTHRLVCWNRGARFKLDVEKGFVDIYFSTVHLRNELGSHAVFVAEDDEKKTYGTGAARFIKYFLLPI